MKLLNTVISVTAIAFVFSACKNVDFKKTSSGVPYKVFSSNNKDTIGPNNVVKFEVIQKAKDTLLFSSYKDARPQYLQVPAVKPAKPVYADIRGTIIELLPTLHVGDSVYITQSTDSIIKANPQLETQAPFKKGDQVITTIKILAVYKSPEDADAAITKENVSQSATRDQAALKAFKADTATQAQMAKDDKIIEDYLAANHIQAQKTEWGVYVQMIHPADGPKPKPGQFASIHYIVTNLQQNQIFDSGLYPLQIAMGGSIKGFEEGAKQLSKGASARVFVPSMLAYQAQGNPPKIKPYEILVFNLEMRDISDTRPVPPQQQMPVDPNQK